jgi:hypothetical protein
VIDATEDILWAFPMGNMFVHFGVACLTPLHSKHTNFIPTVKTKFYRLGFDYRMAETSDFADLILPPVDNIATVVADSINYHLDTSRGWTSLYFALYSSLT